MEDLVIYKSKRNPLSALGILMLFFFLPFPVAMIVSDYMPAVVGIVLLVLDLGLIVLLFVRRKREQGEKEPLIRLSGRGISNYGAGLQKRDFAAWEEIAEAKIHVTSPGGIRSVELVLKSPGKLRKNERLYLNTAYSEYTADALLAQIRKFASAKGLRL